MKVEEQRDHAIPDGWMRDASPLPLTASTCPVLSYHILAASHVCVTELMFPSGIIDDFSSSIQFNLFHRILISPWQLLPCALHHATCLCLCLRLLHSLHPSLQPSLILSLSSISFLFLARPVLPCSALLLSITSCYRSAPYLSHS